MGGCDFTEDDADWGLGRYISEEMKKLDLENVTTIVAREYGFRHCHGERLVILTSLLEECVALCAPKNNPNPNHAESVPPVRESGVNATGENSQLTLNSRFSPLRVPDIHSDADSIDGDFPTGAGVSDDSGQSVDAKDADGRPMTGAPT